MLDSESTHLWIKPVSSPTHARTHVGTHTHTHRKAASTEM